MTMVTPPDGGWGWVVMVAAFVNQMLVYGVLKSGGVMYMAIMDEMDVSHTQAALVPSIAFSISAVIGPLSMSLAVNFSAKYVIFIGGILAAFGMAISASYVSSIIFTTIFYGVFVGVACGLIATPNIVTVHTYFNKHRAFASGFALAGGAVGCFFVPPLIEYIAKEHGLRSAFLALSALLLHVCPASLLFRPLTCNKPRRRPRAPVRDAEFSHSKNGPMELKNFNEDKDANGVAEETVVFLAPTNARDDVVKTKNNNFNTKTVTQRPGLCQRLLGVVNIDLSIFCNKYFLIVLYSTMCFVFIWSGYLTLLPDYAYNESADEITKSMAAFLLSAMSVGDVVFRIFFGWVSDRGWLQRKHYHLIFLLVSGCILVCYSLTQTYAMLLASSVFFGVFISGVIVLPPVLMNDYLGPSRFPMAYAVSICIDGLVMFGAPPFLAYIREVTGSYKPCFLLMGLLLMSAALLWVFDEVYITAFPPSKDNDEIKRATRSNSFTVQRGETQTILRANSIASEL